MQRQKTEKTQENNTACSLNVRRSERSLSIPAKLTSAGYVNPNKRRRHTLQTIINTNSNYGNKCHLYSRGDDDIKACEILENERNEITITAVVHLNSVSKQD